MPKSQIPILIKNVLTYLSLDFRLSLKLEPPSCQRENSKGSKESVNQVLLDSLSLSPAKSTDLIRIRKFSLCKQQQQKSNCSK